MLSYLNLEFTFQADTVVYLINGKFPVYLTQISSWGTKGMLHGGGVAQHDPKAQGTRRNRYLPVEAL